MAVSARTGTSDKGSALGKGLCYRLVLGLASFLFAAVPAAAQGRSSPPPEMKQIAPTCISSSTSPVRTPHFWLPTRECS